MFRSEDAGSLAGLGRVEADERLPAERALEQCDAVVAAAVLDLGDTGDDERLLVDRLRTGEGQLHRHLDRLRGVGVSHELEELAVAERPLDVVEGLVLIERASGHSSRLSLSRWNLGKRLSSGITSSHLDFRGIKYIISKKQ